MSDKGAGVHQSYQEQAHKGCDLLFRVKIRGRSMLTDKIPLHMSVKIFTDPSEYKMRDLEEDIEECDLHKPDPKDLTFKPIIFASERDGTEYYMLEVNGAPDAMEMLYNRYKT